MHLLDLGHAAILCETVIFRSLEVIAFSTLNTTVELLRKELCNALLIVVLSRPLFFGYCQRPKATCVCSGSPSTLGQSRPNARHGCYSTPSRSSDRPGLSVYIRERSNPPTFALLGACALLATSYVATHNLNCPSRKNPQLSKVSKKCLPHLCRQVALGQALIDQHLH